MNIFVMDVVLTFDANHPPRDIGGGLNEAVKWYNLDCRINH